MLTLVRCLARRHAGLGVALAAALLAVAVVALPATGRGEEVVTFADSNLEAVVREWIDKPTGEVFVSDVSGLTKFWAVGRDISNLEGMEHFTQLTELHLEDGQISDLTPVSGLTRLTELSLGDNLVSDLTGLSGLTQLTHLFIYSNQIADLTPLSALTELTVLDLTYNRISDLTPLSGLTQLRQLHLAGNQISDLAPLSALAGLTELSLGDNLVSDLTGLSGLTQLTNLLLDHNRIADLTPLSGLVQVTWLHLAGNQISDLTPVCDLDVLHRLFLDDNQINEIGPLVDGVALGEGDWVHLRGNPLNDEAYDVHIPALQARGVYLLFDPRTGVAEAQGPGTLPSAYALYANAPNPFNPVTSIAYDLPEAVQVSLTIHSGLGQQIATLVSGTQQPGQRTVSWNAEGCASGVYFCRLDAGSFAKTRRMVLIR